MIGRNEQTAGNQEVNRFALLAGKQTHSKRAAPKGEVLGYAPQSAKLLEQLFPLRGSFAHPDLF